MTNSHSNSNPDELNIDATTQGLQSINPSIRKHHLKALRVFIESQNIPPTNYFEIVKPSLHDIDLDCKWQAFIIIGSYMETLPAETWNIILNSGNSTDDDTRTAVATILLEHYFEFNPHLFDSKFRELKKVIRNGNQNLLETLRHCRSNWGSDVNRSKVERFLDEKRRKH